MTKKYEKLINFKVETLRAHVLDDKSTAQTKVQIQIVEQLEQQLQKVNKQANKQTNKQANKQTNKQSKMQKLRKKTKMLDAMDIKAVEIPNPPGL